MNQPLKITRTQKKVFYSTLNDGIDEIFTGILCFLVIFIPLIPWVSILMTGLILVLVASWKKVRKKIKTRYVYPRIGYVQLAKSNTIQFKRLLVLSTILIMSSALMFIFYAYLNDWTVDLAMRYFPIVMTTVFLSRMSILWHFTGDKRYMWIGLLNLGMMVGILFIPVPKGKHTFMIFAGFMGFFLLLIGIYKLRSFMQLNPNLSEEFSNDE